MKHFFVGFWKDGLLTELQARTSKSCRFLLFWHHSYQVSLNDCIYQIYRDCHELWWMCQYYLPHYFHLILCKTMIYPGVLWIFWWMHPCIVTNLILVCFSSNQKPEKHKLPSLFQYMVWRVGAPTWYQKWQNVHFLIAQHVALFAAWECTAI